MARQRTDGNGARDGAPVWQEIADEPTVNIREPRARNAFLSAKTMMGAVVGLVVVGVVGTLAVQAYFAPREHAHPVQAHAPTVERITVLEARTESHEEAHRREFEMLKDALRWQMDVTRDLARRSGLRPEPPPDLKPWPDE
jgi:hypothetical protein